MGGARIGDQAGLTQLFVANFVVWWISLLAGWTVWRVIRRRLPADAVRVTTRASLRLNAGLHRARLVIMAAIAGFLSVVTVLISPLLSSDEEVAFRYLIYVMMTYADYFDAEPGLLTSLLLGLLPLFLFWCAVVGAAGSLLIRAFGSPATNSTHE